jgi:hypothetical protein
MGVTYNVVYKDRNNSLSVRLSNTNELGVVTYPDLITGGITKVEILINGKYYCSDDYPDSFDFITEGEDGIVTMVLGTIPEIELVKDAKAEIITYDPSHPGGMVWGTIAIQVIQLVGVDVEPVVPGP